MSIQSSSSSLYAASVTHLNLNRRLMQRKNQNRQSGFMSGTTDINTDIRQRVLSARQNRHKTLQSQLNLVLQQNSVQTDAHFFRCPKWDLFEFDFIGRNW